MKIVITSQGPELSSPMDQTFGRCKQFLLVDTETGEVSAHDNKQNLQAAQGAGIQSAQLVAGLGAKAVVTGNVGPKAYRTLAAAGIPVYLARCATAADALEQFKAGELETAGEATVEGHWI